MDAINFQTARAQLGGIRPVDRVPESPKTFVPVTPVRPIQGQAQQTAPLTIEQALRQAAANQTIVGQTGAGAAVMNGAGASQAAANRTKIASRLVAGVVAGGVSFGTIGGVSGDVSVGASGPTGTTTAPARPNTPQPTLPLYRHPADRNIAATGVQAGRVIDVVG
jgi:hypothetical protein